MRRTRKVSRRSFFATVAGGAVMGGSATALLTGQALALVQGCSDNDPASSGDPGGHGRRCQGTSETGVTDSDPTDAGGHGRGPSAPRTGTGITDSDSGDPVGGGRGNRPGQNVNPRAYTGVTDSDSGPNHDPVGSGRGSGPVQSREQQSCAAWRAREDAIQRQLSQFPYWSDQQINAAAQTRDWLGGVANPTGDPEDRWTTGARVTRGPQAAAVDNVCRQYGLSCGQNTDIRMAASAQGQLDNLIRQALAARGQRQALENELYRVRQSIGRSC